MAVIIVAIVFIVGTILVCIGSYYLFVSSLPMGTGTFASTMDDFSTINVLSSIALQMMMYLLLIGITFFVGLFANPFVTFILTIVIMYAENYLAGAENFVSRLFPNYWSNQIILNGTASTILVLTAVFVIVALTVILMLVTTMFFEKQDIK